MQNFKLYVKTQTHRKINFIVVFLIPLSLKSYLFKFNLVEFSGVQCALFFKFKFFLKYNVHQQVFIYQAVKVSH